MKQKNFRFSPLTLGRLEKLADMLPTKAETGIVEDAVAHYLGTLERDEPVYQTIPSEAKDRERDHPNRTA